MFILWWYMQVYHVYCYEDSSVVSATLPVYLH